MVFRGFATVLMSILLRAITAAVSGLAQKIVFRGAMAVCTSNGCKSKDADASQPWISIAAASIVKTAAQIIRHLKARMPTS